MIVPLAKLKVAATTLAAMSRHIYEAVANWTWLAGPASYRPEAHYMRGPGPKWRAKHGLPARAFARSGLRDTTRTI